MTDATRKAKKARVGKLVVPIALAADPTLRQRPTTVSNWRQGANLPRLEEFLEYCKRTGTTDLTPFLDAMAG